MSATMAHSIRLIDPPSSFSPLADWQEFLSDMEALLRSEPDNPQLLEHRDLALREIALIKDRKRS